jgi:hypothetical protein
LTNGDADLTLALDRESKLSGENCSIEGNLSLVVADINISAPVRIANGSFRTEGDTPIYSGKLSTDYP